MKIQSLWQGGPTLKTNYLLAIAITIAAGSIAKPASAQQPQAGGIVAVMDVKRVFDEHQRFQNQLSVVKEEVKAFEQQVLKQRESLMAEQKALVETHKSDTNAYKQGEARLARLVSDLEVQRKLKQKEILSREARLYYETYQEIVGAVEAFANKNNISLVLKYDSKPIDRNQPPEVLQGVNRDVVFQRNRDLTNIIVNIVNGS